MNVLYLCKIIETVHQFKDFTKVQFIYTNIYKLIFNCGTFFQRQNIETLIVKKARCLILKVLSLLFLKFGIGRYPPWITASRQLLRMKSPPGQLTPRFLPLDNFSRIITLLDNCPRSIAPITSLRTIDPLGFCLPDNYPWIVSPWTIASPTIAVDELPPWPLGNFFLRHPPGKLPPDNFPS